MQHKMVPMVYMIQKHRHSRAGPDWTRTWYGFLGVIHIKGSKEQWKYMSTNGIFLLPGRHLRQVPSLWRKTSLLFSFYNLMVVQEWEFINWWTSNLKRNQTQHNKESVLCLEVTYIWKQTETASLSAITSIHSVAHTNTNSALLQKFLKEII